MLDRTTRFRDRASFPLTRVPLVALVALAALAVLVVPATADASPPSEASSSSALPSAASSWTQDVAQEEAEEESQEEDEDEEDLKPYEEVIPEDAVTDEGIFITHRVDEKLYYEIPRRELGRDLLWVSRIAKAQHGMGYGGELLANRVVRWERRPGDRKVLLREASYEVVADTARPIFRAVEAATFQPVIKAFEVETLGPDSAPVIEVTDFFTEDVPEFSPRERLRAASLDQDRSFLEEVLAFPDNVEVRALLTFQNGREQGPRAGTGIRLGGISPSTISVMMHHSMVRLPEELMRPRLADDRVGYFEVHQFDFGIDRHEAPRRRLITRWRLEPEDPGALERGELTEPVEPIVFYIDSATPEPWRSWLKKGVESWNAAFEKAGFRNAVEARMAPTPEEDPEWHPEDARYSVIRWLPSTIQNARGPHIHDPRSGEILEADIRWFHNVLKLLRDWYFVQVSPLDERAAQLPLPDSLMGRLVQYVAAHEVGHTLGLPHNMKSASSYPVDSLRSATFTEKYGNQASIMDYGRFNYVAQPGDGAKLVPIVGPYDEFSVMWGYRPIPEAESPEDERPVLDEWARWQEDDPMLRFGRVDGIDPSAQTEAMGDDPVRATELGLRNLERVMERLVPATGREGESYEELQGMYNRVVNHWRRLMRHVVTVVGGVYRQEKYYGQEGVVHTPVPREEQRRAVEFLLENAFHPPELLIDPDVQRRFEPAGTVDRISSIQAGLLRDLVRADRLRRLLEEEALRAGGGEPYLLEEMLADVRRGVWSELDRRSVRIGPYRRNLQREHVRILTRKLESESDIGALVRGELRDLRDRIGERVPRADDRMTRLHLEDMHERIDRALNPG